MLLFFNQMYANQIPPSYSTTGNAEMSEKESTTKLDDSSTCKAKKLSRDLLKSLVKKDKNPWQVLATKTPQWTWTNTQCREWLTAIGVWYLGYDEDKAKGVAERFVGFGPTLFAKTIQCWEVIFIHKLEANAVCTMIYNLQKEKGAVPKGIGRYDPWKPVKTTNAS